MGRHKMTQEATKIPQPPAAPGKGGLRTRGITHDKLAADSPLVSIITISFNSAATIERAICSVLKQSYRGIEYIIVDGASWDATVKIIRRYEDRIDYWQSEKDRGISDAFNKGIKLSTGSILGILNSDDWYEKDAVLNAVKAFSEDQDAAIVHGNLRLHHNEKYLFTIRPQEDVSSLRTEMVCNHPTCFVRREVYDKCGLFNTKLKYAMDHELLLRAYLAGFKFRYSPGVTANMQLGGRGDIKALSGFREVRDTSIAMGCPKLLAYMVFFRKAVRNFLRDRLGIQNPLRRWSRRADSSKFVEKSD